MYYYYYKSKIHLTVDQPSNYLNIEFLDQISRKELSKSCLSLSKLFLTATLENYIKKYNSLILDYRNTGCGVFKIRKVFALESTYPNEMIEF